MRKKQLMAMIFTAAFTAFSVPAALTDAEDVCASEEAAAEESFLADTGAENMEPEAEAAVEILTETCAEADPAVTRQIAAENEAQENQAEVTDEVTTETGTETNAEINTGADTEAGTTANSAASMETNTEASSAVSTEAGTEEVTEGLLAISDSSITSLEETAAADSLIASITVNFETAGNYYICAVNRDQTGQIVDLAYAKANNLTIDSSGALADLSIDAAGLYTVSADLSYDDTLDESKAILIYVFFEDASGNVSSASAEVNTLGCLKFADENALERNGETVAAARLSVPVDGSVAFIYTESEIPPSQDAWTNAQIFETAQGNDVIFNNITVTSAGGFLWAKAYTSDGTASTNCAVIKLDEYIEITTPTPVPTATPAPTASPVPTSTPCPTAVPTSTPDPTAVPTSTPVPTAVPTTRAAIIHTLDECTVTGLEKPLTFYTGASYPINAAGSGPDSVQSASAVEGDTYYTPVYWSMYTSPTDSQKHTSFKISSNSSSLKSNTYTIYVFFRKMVFTNGSWTAEGDEYKAVSFNAIAATATPTGSAEGTSYDSSSSDGSYADSADAYAVSTDGSTSYAGNSTGTSPVKTADESPLASFITLLFASMAAGGFVIRRKYDKEL